MPWPFISENRYLSKDEMKINASYIYMRLSFEGWTISAMAGMLGNMQTESTINPGIWQNLDEGNMNLGYGLVQWTPASKYIDWAKANGYPVGHINSQLNRILYEVEKNIQWIHPSITFKEYTQMSSPPYDMAMLFLHHYERPADPNQPNRGTQAEYWYEFLMGHPAPEPLPPECDEFFNIILGRRFLPRRK